VAFWGVVGGISAPFARNPNRQPEILTFSGCFESSAEDLKLQRLFQIFSDLLE
jgi:hypothetical protein